METMTNWVIGVDLGGTKVELGLVSPQNEIVARRRMATQAADGPERVVERIGVQVAELAEALPAGKQVAALGICCPGPLDHETGMLINPTNLPKFYNTPLRQMLSERLGLPVSLEHDAKAAALGEFYFGAGQVARNMVYIVIGTGVGAAIILDGQLHRGARNFAGEVGHIMLDRQGEPCACGSRGCVETYMSGPWLARHYRRGATGPVAEITGADVSRLAAQGDRLALQVMNEAGEALGVAIATIAMLIDVDLYVIGGSVAKSGELFLAPARRRMPDYSFPSVSAGTEIVASQLEEDAPILGCAWLARGAGGVVSVKSSVVWK